MRNGRLQGCADIPLNENGRELARITGEALKEVPFDLIITSPLQRARETGALVRSRRSGIMGERFRSFWTTGSGRSTGQLGRSRLLGAQL